MIIEYLYSQGLQSVALNDLATQLVGLVNGSRGLRLGFVGSRGDLQFMRQTFMPGRISKHSETEGIA